MQVMVGSVLCSSTLTYVFYPEMWMPALSIQPSNYFVTIIFQIKKSPMTSQQERNWKQSWEPEFTADYIIYTHITYIPAALHLTLK